MSGRINKHLLALLSILCFTSCKPPEPALEEGSVELTGVAGNLPDHSEKANCQGITVNGNEILFKGKFFAIPNNTLGKKLKVTGILKKRNLPMFIWDKEKHPIPDGEDGVVPLIVGQGIPMPPGTNIEKESIYYVIQNPKWEVFE